MSEQPINIVITIQPPNKANQRRVDVMGAPVGEMPLLLSGSFADRHKLVDQVYGQLVRRAPQVLKGAAAKDQVQAEAEPAAAEAPADQIGPVETPAAETTEALPVIAGDDAPAEGSEGDDDE